MNISIQNGSKAYDISLEQFTQFCGDNLVEKSVVINAIRKYFSSSKYNDFENTVSIKCGKDTLGRQYFKTFSIASRADILLFIRISKQSLFNVYLANVLNDFDYQTDFAKIENILSGVFDAVNERIENEIGAISLEYQVNGFEDLLRSSEVYPEYADNLELLGTYELFDIFINIIVEIEKRDPSRVLIIFENIDHLLHAPECKLLQDKCINISKRNDIWCLFSMNISEYVYINETYFEGINVFNDYVIALPQMDKVLDYICKNYPVNKSIEKEVFEAAFSSIVNDIGKTLIINPIAYVIAKILDKSFMIEDRWLQPLNSIESSFMATNNCDIIKCDR